MEDLIALFESANARFIAEEQLLLTSAVSERTLCGALMCYLKQQLVESPYSNYFVDVEYNRNQGKVKTIIDSKNEIVTINCDLIIHSRGTIRAQDNILALEMKKSTNTRASKESDRIRLIALTKTSYDDIWSFDGINLPKHVCGYLLGVYYEINLRRHEADIEYYVNGRLTRQYTISLQGPYGR